MDRETFVKMEMTNDVEDCLEYSIADIINFLNESYFPDWQREMRETAKRYLVKIEKNKTLKEEEK